MGSRAQRAASIRRCPHRARADLRGPSGDRSGERAPARSCRAPTRGALQILSPQVAELITSESGEGLLAGRRAYITASSVTYAGSRRSPRRLPRGALRCLARVPGRTRRADPGARRDARACRRRRADGVLQRPSPLSDHELHAVRLALPRTSGSTSSPRRGASGGSSSGSVSGSSPGTRRLAGSASRGATTTERSGP